MSLREHLAELRKRLFISAIAILVGIVAGFVLAQPTIHLISGPIREIAESHNAVLNFDTVTGAFDVTMKIAITIGVVVASPVWLYQIWAFLVPGLTRKEKVYALGFVGSAIPLFLAGCVAGWFVFPHIITLLAGFTPSEAANFYQAGYYYDFVLKLVLAVGVAFVLPLLLVLLNFVGVLSAKSIIRSWRVAILVIALFCAIATPAADVVSMFLLAIPMVVLYFTAWGIAWMHDRRLTKSQLALDPEVAT